MGAYLRELELLVVGVHLADLVACRRAQDFDDLDQLVDARVARKDWLAEEELGEHAACRPNVYFFVGVLSLLGRYALDKSVAARGLSFFFSRNIC